MKSINRGDLNRKMAKLVGFGYEQHPLNKKWWIHVVFYWIQPDEWIICLGEVKDKPKPEEMRPHLGDMVPGAAIAPYAERNIKGLKSYDEFKKMVLVGFPEISFEWWNQELR
jgi:hypothetical protein